MKLKEIKNRLNLIEKKFGGDVELKFSGKPVDIDFFIYPDDKANDLHLIIDNTQSANSASN